jgi:hypothetical protein
MLKSLKVTHYPQSMKSLMQLIRQCEDAAVPELAQFSAVHQARLIRRSTELFRMKHALLANAPLYFCCIGGVVGWGGLPLALGSLGLKVSEIQVALVCSTIGSALGGFIGGSMGKQALFRWMRPHVRAIIQPQGKLRETPERQKQ